jgi:hypothetical protein
VPAAAPNRSSSAIASAFSVSTGSTERIQTACIRSDGSRLGAAQKVLTHSARKRIGIEYAEGDQSKLRTG